MVWVPKKLTSENHSIFFLILTHSENSLGSLPTARTPNNTITWKSADSDKAQRLGQRSLPTMPDTTESNRFSPVFKHVEFGRVTEKQKPFSWFFFQTFVIPYPKARMKLEIVSIWVSESSTWSLQDYSHEPNLND